jgi:hypothetical protein
LNQRKKVKVPAEKIIKQTKGITRQRKGKT